MKLLAANKVFFPTIDVDYLGFFAIALLRSLLGRSTTGLFLRPLQCFRTERPIIYPLKRLGFRWICKIPRLTLLSIIPHELHPELKEVSHDWIYDPQMWDLWLDGPPTLPDTNLSKRIQAARKERSVLIYIGSANKIKGFIQLCEFAQQNISDTLVVVAGRVAKECRAEMQALINAGMIVENRYISDQEILSLYKVADYAWCRYLPEYDQASGVFGRAIQTGVTPLLRAGSLLDRMLNVALKTSPIEKLSRDLSTLKKLR